MLILFWQLYFQSEVIDSAKAGHWQARPLGM
jgi:hypothetical protein